MRRSLALGAALTALVLAGGLLSFVWTPHAVDGMAIADRLKPPSAAHWLGTDHFGRDILSMIMVGARTSIAVALVAVGIGMGLGVPLGLAAAAHKGGWLDEVISRGNDLIFAFPSLVIAILITAVFGAGAVNAIVAIGIFNVPVFARLTRGAYFRFGADSAKILGELLSAVAVYAAGGAAALADHSATHGGSARLLLAQMKSA